ncbi:MAG: protein-L-isoaspartate O-methyltransferase [Patescibacteria group bacterium]
MKKELLVKFLTKNGYVKSLLIKDAFMHVNRADFIGEEAMDDANENLPIAIGFERTIPQPSTVAFMLELVEPKFGEKILHIGSGSGWQTALLAYIVGSKAEADAPAGKVIAIESVEELSQVATKNLETYHFISNNIADVIHGDAKEGFAKGAPYDKIVSSVTLKEIPRAWKDEVRIGGRIVAPIGEHIVVLDKTSADSFSRRQYFGFDFSSGE